MKCMARVTARERGRETAIHGRKKRWKIRVCAFGFSFSVWAYPRTREKQSQNNNMNVLLSIFFSSSRTVLHTVEPSWSHNFAIHKVGWIYDWIHFGSTVESACNCNSKPNIYFVVAVVAVFVFNGSNRKASENILENPMLERTNTEKKHIATTQEP